MSSNNVKLFVIWVLVILLILNIVLIYLNFRYQRSSNNYYNEEMICKSRMNLLNKSFQHNIEFSLELEGKEISNNLLKLVKYNSSIFLKLNDRGCNACIEIISTILNKCINYERRGNIIIISSFNSQKELSFFQNMYFENCKVIDFKSELYVDIDDNMVDIYFFKIDDRFRICKIFVFDKNFPELSVPYLNKLLNDK